MGIRRALIPVSAKEAMSSWVMKVAQCSARASDALLVEEKLYSSTASVSSKRSAFIHSSSTSQPPRLTPRKKGILGSAVDVEDVEDAAATDLVAEVARLLVELAVLEAFFEEYDAVNVLRVLAPEP